MEKPTGLLDRYILAKTRNLVDGVSASMDSYDLAAAAGEVRGFLDALNNWYIRRSRTRFWRPMGLGPELDADKSAAYDTLYTVLETLTRTVAPLLPLLSEEIWRGLEGVDDSGSVHLADWPDAGALPLDPELVAGMDLAREVCTAALGLRNESGLRVRLPLASLTVAGPGTLKLQPFFDLIRDEVNVKAVRVDEEVEALGSHELFVNARAAGPRLGKQVKDVIAASKRGEWSLEGERVVAGGVTLEDGEYELRLVPRPGLEDQAVQALPKSGIVIGLDTKRTPALEREGLARDLVRHVQEARKSAGLDVADRIRLRLDLGAGVAPEVAAAVEEFAEYVKSQTLAVELELAAAVAGAADFEASLGGAPIRIAVSKVSR